MHWGIIRYLPFSGRAPEDDKCSFDGWYTHEADARGVYAMWCERFPGWVVAVIQGTEVRFDQEPTAA